MAKVNALLHGFAVGEISRAAMARVDQERVKLAAEIQENLFPHTIGKGLVRPGTLHLGSTASNARARLIDFVKSVDETAVLELTDAALRIQVDDALVTRAAVTSSVVNGDFSVASATVTITIATPAVISWAGHPFVGDGTEIVYFKTSGALPTGIVAGTPYYVISAGLVAGTSFRVSTSSGGGAVNTSGSQSGTHTADKAWVTTVENYASSTVGSSRMTMQCPYRGGTALAKQTVTTATANAEHAIRIVVDRGPVIFRCGSTDGGDEYIGETDLDEGTHSLAFTPTASPYYIQFFTRSDIEIRITSVAIEAAGVLSFSAPWSLSELRGIRKEQSADVVFLSHTNWQQRKIERRGDASWSLIKYKADDGPFAIGRAAEVSITPAALNGNTTLTSDRPYFTADMVGSLMKVTHNGQAVNNTVAGPNEFTDSWKVIGTGSDRAYTVTSAGTWVGSLSLQRSFDGPDSGFFTAGTIASAGSSSQNDGLDNATTWYRVGFPSGGFTSGAVTVTNSAFGQGSGFGICRIVGFTSSTQVSVEVLTAFKGTSATKEWQAGEWSDVNGWPSAVAFFDGRLWWARDDRVWGSESDNYTAFNLETEGDAGSIQRSIATGGAVNSTNWMLPLQRLLFGTDGSEATARASSFDQPLTPTAFTIKDASTQGVAPVSPAKMDGRGVFVQRCGTRVYEILYSLERQDYVSTSLSKFNQTIGGTGLLEIAVQRQPESYIWMVRADGQCPVLLYDPGEQVAGWFRFIAAPSLAGDAVVESVCVLPESGQDAVYLSVKRTINGSVVRFREKLMQHADAIGSATTKMADAAVFSAGPVTSVTAAHLASETGLVGWGTTGGVSGPITGLSADGSGVITLGATYTNVWVGLPYTWRYKSSKLAYAAQGGTALLQRKRVLQVGMLAEYLMYGAIQFGPDFDTLDPLPLIKDGATISQTTVYEEWDEPSFPFRGEWNTDSRLCMSGSAPYPATLLGIVVGIQTNEG